MNLFRFIENFFRFVEKVFFSKYVEKLENEKKHPWS